VTVDASAFKTLVGQVVALNTSGTSTCSKQLAGSIGAEGHRRIDPRGTSRGNPRGQDAGGGKDDGDLDRVAARSRRRRG
jgi:hypothetical protein